MFLGSSEEYEDGYYSEVGKFRFDLRTDKWFKIEKHYCVECRQKFILKFNQILKELGFEEF